MTDLVHIKSFASRHEADMARGILESNGIKAIVRGDDYGGLGPHILYTTGGAHLYVNERDAADAVDILEKYNKSF